MFVITIILGLSLNPIHCDKANEASIIRRQADSSQLHYNSGSQNSSNYNYKPSQNSKYGYGNRPSGNYNISRGSGFGLTGAKFVPSNRLVSIIRNRNVSENKGYEVGGEPVPELLMSTGSNNPSHNNELIRVTNPNIESINKNKTALDAGPDDFTDDFVRSVTEEGERFLWQVSVFSKKVTPHMRVCGGTLVTSSAVISAAQCFSNVGPLPAEQFAVGAGEAAPDQANCYEAYQYKTNVRDIRLPARFRGGENSFQDDVAVLLLAQPLAPGLKPVCVSFDWDLDDQQLAEGNEGTVLDIKETGWNWDLRNQRVSYIGVEECMRKAPIDEHRYITSDKICAGFIGVKDPRTVYLDTGSGLVYFHGSSPSIPFLRGVVSLHLEYTRVTVFTHVVTHRAFLLRHVSGLEEECARHYGYSRAEEMGKGEGGGNEFICNCYC